MTDTPKTVRCRIALVVDRNGSWRAQGDSVVSDDKSLFSCEELFGRRPLNFMFVEVDVPVPTVPVIQAEAKPAEEK